MRYFMISYPDEQGFPIDETLSEEDIRREYWDHWYSKMCTKFGKEYVDKNYSFEECLDDWCVIHWAVKV